jgi:hypothetical protein
MIRTFRTVNGVPTVTTIQCIHSVCRPYHDVPWREARSRYGIACLPPQGEPDRNLNPAPPPESFAVTDMAKPGFPNLAPSEASLVRVIQRYVRSSTLRIAWLPPDRYRRRQRFIIFDAVGGPCSTAFAYRVLNGGCNEMYQASVSQYATWAAPGCAKMTPPPWTTAETRFGRR